MAVLGNMKFYIKAAKSTENIIRYRTLCKYDILFAWKRLNPLRRLLLSYGDISPNKVLLVALVSQRPQGLSSQRFTETCSVSRGV